MARQQFDLIVFDWDGTLMDSTAHITRSIQAACRAVSVPLFDQGRANRALRRRAQLAAEPSRRGLPARGRNGQKPCGPEPRAGPVTPDESLRRHTMRRRNLLKAALGH